MKLVFATSDSKQKNEVLTEMGVKHRLVSYFYVGGLGVDPLAHFQKHGEFRPPKIKRKRLPE